MTFTLTNISISLVGHWKRLWCSSQNNKFDKSDLDLDPMTLVLKPDLCMVKMYNHAKNEVSMSRHSQAIARADKQYENITFPLTQALTNKKSHLNSIKIEFMQFQYIDHSYLGITFSFLAIFFTTLT